MNETSEIDPAVLAYVLGWVGGRYGLRERGRLIHDLEEWARAHRRQLPLGARDL